MGKIRNAKRNPAISWDDLKYSVPGDEITTHGETYTIITPGGLGRNYVLSSQAGNYYVMYVAPNGVASHPTLYL